MAVRVLSSITAPVRLEATSSNGPTQPRLSFSKPSWVVRTESNVHREVIKNPDPPCDVCTGSGRTKCNFCCGKGRTNSVDLEMLPKGKWPKWCRTCGGSGLSCCPRCLGTGEYRYIMGFQFMKMDVTHNGNKLNGVESNQKRRTATDLYED